MDEINERKAGDGGVDEKSLQQGNHPTFLRNGRKMYKVELNKTEWTIPVEYQDLQAVGSGAYGQVCSATNVLTNTQVAVKKLSRPFHSDVHAKRTYRELRMLKHMNHDNIIGLLDVFTTAEKPDENFKDLYLVTNLMGADLNIIIKTQRLSDDHVKFLLYQILRGLKYIHSAGIIHRDLKPSNIAVNENCELKILDFGLARTTEEEMTGYVATRWYRAPEIMLNWMHYKNTMDMWSVGCIFAECLNGKVLFPGKDHICQLNWILEVLGKPDEKLLEKIESEPARKYIESIVPARRTDLRTIFKDANPEAVDLLEKMLEWNVDLRITAEEALAHPYLKQYADPSDEPVSLPYDHSFEASDAPLESWRHLVFEEIKSFKPREE